MNVALFLDRDGVINVDGNYVHNRHEFLWCDGIFELCRAAHQHGYRLIVVTNQSGIGRGRYSQADFASLMEWMCNEMSAQGAPIAKVYHCPYHPDAVLPQYRADHPWRKPAPGMILQARDDLGLDLSRSILIGDRPSDIAAASLAGIGISVFVGSPAVAALMNVPPSVVVSDIRATIDWFLGRHRSS